MTVNIDETLPWETATGDEATMLENLQPNILKGHVRDFLSVIFLRFDDTAEGRAFLGLVRRKLMKSAKDHLQEVRAHAQWGTDGTPYVGVGLTSAGYSALGVTPLPGDTSFGQPGGMKGSRTGLNDPPLSTWEAPFREEIHAVVLVGDSADHEQRYELTRQAVLALVTDGITVLVEENGRTLSNAAGDGIEHFGYVDGRSQPLFLNEDISAENGPSTPAWNPAFPLKQVIVSDPAAPDPPVHFGSYLVFRKLEQNVALFKQGELDLADRLGLIGEDRERAGAMMVGRFEDGTAATVQEDEAGLRVLVRNDFNYDADTEGSKCPFHAHIRKANPRGTDDFERSHLMARRGQTYGHRTDDPGADLPPSRRPADGVGLLFMAFNADLGNQFEFTQAKWVNNERFPFGTQFPEPGLDPVIGQGVRGPVHYAPEWGGTDQVETADAAQAVTLKGGQYFFVPSLAFLGTLAPEQ
jgi:Dyp-type peroxidase family